MLRKTIVKASVLRPFSYIKTKVIVLHYSTRDPDPTP